jgi:hypothetical protein
MSELAGIIDAALVGLLMAAAGLLYGRRVWRALHPPRQGSALLQIRRRLNSTRRP